MNRLVAGFIDAATLYEVTVALDPRYSSPDDLYTWAFENALVSTSALINTAALVVAPAPDHPRGTGSGTYPLLLEGLQSIVVDSPTAHKERARGQTSRWLARESSILEVRTATGALENDEANFRKWLTRSISTAWIDHSGRLGGLFNEEYIGALSQILDVPTIALKKAHKASTELKRVEEWTRLGLDSKREDFTLVRKAYVASSLIRAMYHRNFARLCGLDILHHPFRRGVLSQMPRRRVTHSLGHFAVSNSEWHLCKIILGDALQETEIRARVGRWTRSVTGARTYVQHAGEEQLLAADCEDRAIRQASKVAKRIGIVAPSVSLKRASEILVAVGVGALTHFTAMPWSLDLAMDALAVGTLPALVHDASIELPGGERYRRMLDEWVPGELQEVMDRDQL